MAAPRYPGSPRPAIGPREQIRPARLDDRELALLVLAERRQRLGDLPEVNPSQIGTFRPCASISSPSRATARRVADGALIAGGRDVALRERLRATRSITASASAARRARRPRRRPGPAGTPRRSPARARSPSPRRATHSWTANAPAPPFAPTISTRSPRLQVERLHAEQRGHARQPRRTRLGHAQRRRLRRDERRRGDPLRPRAVVHAVRRRSRPRTRTPRRRRRSRPRSRARARPGTTYSAYCFIAPPITQRSTGFTEVALTATITSPSGSGRSSRSAGARVERVQRPGLHGQTFCGVRPRSCTQRPSSPRKCAANSSCSCSG